MNEDNIELILQDRVDSFEFDFVCFQLLLHRANATLVDAFLFLFCLNLPPSGRNATLQITRNFAQRCRYSQGHQGCSMPEWPDAGG